MISFCSFISNQELYGLPHFYSFILCKYTLLTTTKLFLFRVQSYDDYFKPLLNDLLYDSFRQRVFSLKIRLHSKQELLGKDFLESCNVILFIKHEHSLLMSRVLSQKHYLFHSPMYKYLFINRLKFTPFLPIIGFV